MPDDDLAEVFISLGEARARLGRSRSAFSSYEAAIRKLRRRPVRAAQVLREEATLYSHQGRHPVALRTVTRGLRLLDGSIDESALAARSRLKVVSGGVRLQQGRYPEALRWAREAEQDAQGSGDAGALASAQEILANCLTFVGLEADRPYGELALAGYEQVGDLVGQSRTLDHLAFQAWLAGRGAEALGLFARAEEVAAEAGDAGGAAASRFNRCDALLRLGRVSEARATVAGLLPVLLGLGDEAFHAAALRTYAVATAFEGDQPVARALLADARGAQERLGETAEVVETDAALALVLLHDGDHDSALSLATDAAGRAAALGAGYLQPWVLRLQGAALSDAGRLDEAAAALADACSLAEDHGRVELGFIYAELATVARRCGDPVGADAFAARSDEAFELLGFRGDPRYPYPR